MIDFCMRGGRVEGAGKASGGRSWSLPARRLPSIGEVLSRASLRDRRLPEDLAEVADIIGASRLAALLATVVSPPLNRGTDITLYGERLRMLSLAFKYAESEDVPGDYAEFGVWRGRNVIEAWRISHKYGIRRRFWAYDSFEGLPELSERDEGGPFHTGHFAHGRNRFEARLHRARVPAADVIVVEGWFDKTLTDPSRPAPTSIALAWIDCDLYESTVSVLRYLTPRINPGSILMFDDWYTFRADPDKGEMRACEEWLAEHPGIRIIPWRPFHFAGQSFIVQRTGR